MGLTEINGSKDTTSSPHTQDCHPFSLDVFQRLNIRSLILCKFSRRWNIVTKQDLAGKGEEWSLESAYQAILAKCYACLEHFSSRDFYICLSNHSSFHSNTVLRRLFLTSVSQKGALLAHCSWSCNSDLLSPWCFCEGFFYLLKFLNILGL